MPGQLRAFAVFAGLLVVACGATEPTTGTPPTTPEAPQGPTTRVSTAPAFSAALASLSSGGTILLEPGTYPVDEAFVVPDPRADITIAGATGRRDDVVIRGGRFGIWVNAVTRLTVRDLTIEGASEHGIILGCAADAPVVRNVVLRNIGDQFIKANPGPGGCGVDAGLVEDSLFEYTQGAPDWYTNGVDVHSGANWTIRRNTFRGFSLASGELVGPAILFWNGSRNTTIEGNTFENNGRDVALGFDPAKTSQPPHSNPALTDHQGGRVAGNTIRRRAGLAGADVAIYLADSPGTRIDGNSIVMAGTYPNAIEYRFPRTTGVVISGNVADARIQSRDGASGTVSGNTTP